MASTAPTAALGVVKTKQVLDLVRRLRDQGLAVMLISHNLNDVFEVADRIAVLRLGRIVVQGPARDFNRQRVARVRNGDSGVLPVVAGMVLIAIVFEAISPSHVFLSAGNIVNLFQQSAVFMVLAMAQCFVLLLGEIDLSVGYVGPLGGIICVQLVQPSTTNGPWWAAIVAALLASAVIGALQGTLITRLRIPSFIVTLAGFLIFNGVALVVLGFGPFSGYPSLIGLSPNLQVISKLMYGNVDPTVSWVAMLVIVVLLGSGI